MTTPLWPAGHLSLKGGEWTSSASQQVSGIAVWSAASWLLISPLEGEMAGRPEGGAPRKVALA